jgi:hypothetical protein
MKNPLIQAIVESDWTFAPVVRFFRPLGHSAAVPASDDCHV